MDTSSDAASRFVAIDKLSDLLDYALKDFEASGLELEACEWIENDCGCLAGGVMHQTFGLRRKAHIADFAEQPELYKRFDAISYGLFGLVSGALAVLGQPLSEGYPERGITEPRLEYVKRLIPWLRERGL